MVQGFNVTGELSRSNLRLKGDDFGSRFPEQDCVKDLPVYFEHSVSFRALLCVGHIGGLGA
ncbi:hypothetical protein BN874_70008 [Candidatus Contendobacter odensis Run_B_J11]|uniref:Uncharacterized protein n=1 Tax=Candidatus Contendobacter odensis Run_B_J11 TaxID=1400861 RepID=A0A7U7GF79_9GAMM|nr:hypothetical protein BN874_70008 [Candidatus Contendobacter odensis Run_B_J11]